MSCCWSRRDDLANLSATAHHHGAIGEFDDLIHVVRDEDDGVPLFAQALDEVDHLSRFPHAERGRGLVEDHDLAGESGGAGHSDRLTLTARHQADLRIELGQNDLNRSSNCWVSRSMARVSSAMLRGSHSGFGELAAGVEIAGRVHIVEERKVLVDRLDTGAAGFRRRVDRRGDTSISTTPASSRWTPLMHLISVDFPAPLSPSSASTSLA